MIRTLRYINTPVPFVWVGFIGAISFMEAWLKFTAPTVTLVTGLSIGKVVFTALNRVEWSFTIVLLVCVALTKPLLKREVFLFTAIVILILQTVWLLPELSRRADLYLSGFTPQPSSLHFYFVVMEVFKAIALLIYGYKQLYKHGN